MPAASLLRDMPADRIPLSFDRRPAWPRSWQESVPYALLCLLVARVVWLGTLNEDAFVSYRCLENLMHGLGLTWLADLRTQPYSHPLWMLLHVPLRLVIPDVKAVGFLLSFLCLAGVLGCLQRNYSAWRPAYSLVVLTPLLLSKCFTEYSTTGLEPPLSHLLAVLFFTGFLGDRGKRFDMDRAAFLAAAAVLNRHEHFLLYVLPLIVLWLERRQYEADTRSLVVASLPVVAWFAFAIFYYGSAFPDPYHASATAGIDADILVAQGLTSLLRFMELDLPSFVTILLGTGFAAFIAARSSLARETRLRFLASGVGLLVCVACIVSSGGELMIGSLLSTPFVVAVVLLAESLLVASGADPACGGPAVSTGRFMKLEIGLCTALAACFVVSQTIPDFILGRPVKPSEWKFGSLDAHRHPWNFRLRTWSFSSDFTAAGDVSMRNSLAAPASEHFVETKTSAGLYGFSCGPSYGMLDGYGVVDPLLCRLPAQTFQPGRSFRKIPAGYEGARRTGDTSEMNPQLTRYYETLRAVKSDPLFSMKRIGTAIAFAAGAEADRIDAYVAEMIRDPGHGNDFWSKPRDRSTRMAIVANQSEARGPLVTWYAKLFSNTGATDTP